MNLRKGDHLLFWLTKKGYLGFGTVIDDPRAPNGREEAPWLGGVERFGTVVPFKLDFETPNPLFLKFGKEGQEITGVKPFTLQSGLALITDSAALQCAKLIQESIGTKGAE